MKSIFLKTFGGLSASYIIRQYFFGILIGAFFLGFLSMGESAETRKIVKAPLIAFTIVSVILYPYARYVFDSVVSFILGGNLFILPIPVMLMIKFANMILCFAFAIFMAPLGLLYLYFYHSKQDKSALTE